MLCYDLAFFKYRLDALEHNPDGLGTHVSHGLAHGGEGRSVERRGGDVVEADYRAMFGDAESGGSEGADGAEGGHIVECEECGELALLPDEGLGKFLAGLKTGKRIARFREIDDQTRIEFQPALFGALADAVPAWRAIGQGLGAANESDLAMTE